MKFKNGWGSTRKQADRYLIELRLGKITVFKLLIDVSDKHYELGLFNFSVVI